MARESQSVDFSELVREWEANPDLEGELVHHRVVPGSSAIYEALDPPLSGPMAARLAENGVSELYRHQARAIRKIREGTHTVLVSGTASGKTLCYQIPIAERILEVPKSTALLLFPTKALAQDQLRSFRQLRIPGLNAATYDGDVTSDERPGVRKHSNVIFTNPDMLHFGILPYHAKWAEFFLRLRYVVIDEMHYLRGMFGSHTSHIIRRLRRVAAHYGSDPTFVFASATIGNPADLAGRLSGLGVEVVEGDDSPTGDRVVALWNPPLEDPEQGTRRSSLAETTDLFVDLVRREQHTIVFARSRKGTELIYRWAADRLGDLSERIAPYRSGYNAADRRETEGRLFSGDLLGVTTTNALELGIDVGSLDAALINTFPGTLASFRQQSGRAGRSKDSSLVTLIGGQDALDQYFMHHPDEMFTRPPEAAVINPNNPQVLDAHAACAAYELPLSMEDRAFIGDDLEEAVNRLVQAGHLRLRDGKLYWARRQPPSPQLSLRSSGGPTFTIYDLNESEQLGTVEQERAFRDTHEGAIYLHQGNSYLVERMDLKRHEIAVRPTKVDYYTQPKQDKAMDIVSVEAHRQLGSIDHWLGRVRVESHVVGYQRKKLGSGEKLGEIVHLDLPPTEFETQAFWFTIADTLLQRAGVDLYDIPGTLHAAEHTMIAMMPLFAICDRWDIGGLSTNWQHQTETNTIFIYDGHPGGAGISPVAYDKGQELVEATVKALRECPCATGCPSCVQSPKCGNFNDPLSKDGAIRLLDAALADHAND